MKDSFKELEIIEKLSYKAGVNQRRLLYELYRLEIIKYLRNEDIFEREGVKSEIAKNLIKSSDVCIKDYLEKMKFNVSKEHLHLLKDSYYNKMLELSKKIYHELKN